MRHLIQFIDVVLKLFAFGLFLRAAASWIANPFTRKVGRWLDRIYEPVVVPVRKLVKPVPLNTSPPSALDVAPLIVLVVLWWFVHPFIMWCLS